VGGPGPQGPPGVGTVNSGAVDYVAYYSATTTLAAASGTNNVKIGGVLYANTTAAVLRSVTPSYTDGGRVFIGDSAPTATATGDIWLDTTSSYGYNQSLSTNGWAQLPNGLIIQWGQYRGQVSVPTAVTLTFPVTFSAAAYSIATTSFFPSAAYNPWHVVRTGAGTGVSVPMAQINDDSREDSHYGFDWVAIGPA
jgi:hypothetical protein